MTNLKKSDIEEILVRRFNINKKMRQWKRESGFPNSQEKENMRKINKNLKYIRKYPMKNLDKKFVIDSLVW